MTPVIVSSSSLQISSKAHPQWSPNGKSILFKGNAGLPTQSESLFVVPAPQGGSAANITAGVPVTGIYRAGAWSPDGQNVAFNGIYAGGSELFDVGASGSPWHQLTTLGGTGYKRFPIYSPDGSRIAFVLDIDPATGILGLYVVPAGGGAVTLVDTNVDWVRPSWSPNGQLLTYVKKDPVTGVADVVVADLATGARSNLTNGAIANCAYATFSPDGARIAFYSAPSLYVIAASGGPATPLAVDADDYAITGIGWSPDGTRIAYPYRVSSGAYGVAVVDLQGRVSYLTPSDFASPYTTSFQPSVAPPGTIQIAQGTYDYVLHQLAVSATSAYGSSDPLTLLGIGPMTWTKVQGQWVWYANATTAPAPDRVTVCGRDGCVTR